LDFYYFAIYQIITCIKERYLFLLAAHFAKRNTKFGGGGKRGRAKIPCLPAGRLPPNPLPFCPPERSVWRAKRAINSVQKRFGFHQTNAPKFNYKLCR
jgi:hypothetical protein